MIFEFSPYKSLPKKRVIFPFAWFPVTLYGVNEKGELRKYLIWLGRYRRRDYSKRTSDGDLWFSDGSDPLIGEALKDFVFHSGKTYYPVK